MLETADTMGALVLGASAAKQGATRRDLVLSFQREYRARGFRHWSRGYQFCLTLALLTYDAVHQGGRRVVGDNRDQDTRARRNAPERKR